MTRPSAPPPVGHSTARYEPGARVWVWVRGQWRPGSVLRGSGAEGAVTVLYRLRDDQPATATETVPGAYVAGRVEPDPVDAWGGTARECLGVVPAGGG